MTAPVTYIPDFLSEQDATWLFATLWSELNWERREGAPRREYLTTK